MNKVQRNFIANLEAFLEARHLTQRAFAGLIKRSPETVNRWIKAVNEPSMGDIDSICDKLGISVDVLFGNDSKVLIPPPSPTVEALTKIIEEQERRIKSFEESQSKASKSPAINELIERLAALDEAKLLVVSAFIDTLPDQEAIMEKYLGKSDSRKKGAG